MHRQIIGRFLVLLATLTLLVRCGGETTLEPRFNATYPIYSDLLQRYVDDDGWVDYAGLKVDSALVRRASMNLRAMPPDTLAQYTPIQRMAYWINAYNLLLLEAVVQFYPVDSIGDILNVLDRPHYNVAGQNVSLNDIDRNILQEQFADPRTCFALCRASVNSPILARAPYLAGSLRAQLGTAASRFLTDTTRNVIDPEKREAIISPVFRFYEKEIKKVFWSQIPKDQSEETRAVFNFIADVLPDAQGRFLREEGVSWSYMPVDSRLNDQAKAGSGDLQ